MMSYDLARYFSPVAGPDQMTIRCESVGSNLAFTFRHFLKSFCLQSLPCVIWRTHLWKINLKKKKTLGIQELVFIGESQFFFGGGRTAGCASWRREGALNLINSRSSLTDWIIIRRNKKIKWSNQWRIQTLSCCAILMHCGSESRSLITCSKRD